MSVDPIQDALDALAMNATAPAASDGLPLLSLAHERFVTAADGNASSDGEDGGDEDSKDGQGA